jgi:serine/threonine protein phosphatase 1
VKLAIADIHGRADLLEGIVANTPADTEFVFLGDAVDRGHRNKDAIRLLTKLADEGRMTLLRGNHEAIMLEVDDCYDRFKRENNDLRRNDAKLSLENWIKNGGDTVILEYGGWDDDFDKGGASDAFGPWGLPPELIAFANRCEFTYRHEGGVRGDIFCVHAAPPCQLKGYRSLEDLMVWARPEEGPFPVPEGVLFSLHGHTPIGFPTRIGQNVFIDLGAYWTGHLCTFDLDTLEITVFQGQGEQPLEEMDTLRAVGGIEPVKLEYKVVKL